MDPTDHGVDSPAAHTERRVAYAALQLRWAEQDAYSNPGSFMATYGDVSSPMWAKARMRIVLEALDQWDEGNPAPG